MVSKSMIFALFVFAFLLFSGCAGILGNNGGTTGNGGSGIATAPSYSGGVAGLEKAQSAPSVAPMPPTSSDSSVTPPTQLVDTSGKMVVKTGDMQIVVPEHTLDSKLNELRGIVSASNGQIDSISYSEGDSWKEYTLNVRVPPTAFESLSDKLKTVGTLKSMNTNTEDVTLQWIDREARINNLQTERDRLLELYNRSAEVKDILLVEQELTRVQSDLDSEKAQQTALERQVSLSSLSITLREESPVVQGSLLASLSDIVSAFIGALSFGIIMLAGLLGFGIPIAIALLIVCVIVKLLWDYFTRGKNISMPKIPQVSLGNQAQGSAGSQLDKAKKK